MAVLLSLDFDKLPQLKKSLQLIEMFTNNPEAFLLKFCLNSLLEFYSLPAALLG